MDVVGPKLNSISFSKKALTTPSTVDVTVDAEDDMGIDQIYILLNLDGYFDGNIRTIWLLNGADDWFSGKRTYRADFTSNKMPGTWRVGAVFMRDTLGNWSNYRWLPAGSGGFDGESGTMDGSSVYDEGDEFQSGAYTAPSGSIDMAIEVRSEFNIAAQYNLANPSLPNLVSSLGEGETAKITIGSKSKLSAKVLDSIAGKNVNLLFDGNSYQWIINGKDVDASKTKDIDLAVTIRVADGADYGSEDDVLYVSFADNGVLPGEFRVRLKSDYIYTMFNLTGKVYLYHLSGRGVALEDDSVDHIVDGSDHWCQFYVTHNSSFALSATSLKNPIAAPKAKAGLKYTGKKLTGVAAGTGYSVKGNTATNAGSYTATLTADKNHVFAGGKSTTQVKWSITKASQKIIAKNAAASAKAKKSGKYKKLAKNVTVNLKKKAKVSAKTKVAYKKANKAGGKKIVVNKKTGKVTLKKGLKVGTYKVKVKLTAPKGKNYKAAKAKTITLTVKVK